MDGLISVLHPLVLLNGCLTPHRQRLGASRVEGLSRDGTGNVPLHGPHMILSTGSSNATRHLTDQDLLEPFFISTYLPTTITKKIRLIKGKTHSQKSSQQVISVLFHLRDISKSIEREKTPPSSSKYDLSGVNVARKMKKTSTASYWTKDFCL